MNNDHINGLARFSRQIVYEPVGLAGQKRLAGSSVLIVGAGGLGSSLAEQLARSGVGRLRLIDADMVELENLHRQLLYSESDAVAGLPKVMAAQVRLRQINSQTIVEPVIGRAEAGNILSLMEGMDLVLDGTDNWPSRFLLNEACVKTGTPWVYTGVLGGEGTLMSVLPGRTPCLRCVLDGPPPPCAGMTCREAGVLAPAVHFMASLQAMEAIKILLGRLDALNSRLVRVDLWRNEIRQLDVSVCAANADCPCCRHRQFEHLPA